MTRHPLPAPRPYHPAHVADNPTTVAAKTLLPEWVRWHGEQAGLPEHLIGLFLAAGRLLVGARSSARNQIPLVTRRLATVVRPAADPVTL
jgi:hypothetical protein